MTTEPTLIRDVKEKIDLAVSQINTIYTDDVYVGRQELYSFEIIAELLATEIERAKQEERERLVDILNVIPIANHEIVDDLSTMAGVLADAEKSISDRQLELAVVHYRDYVIKALSQPNTEEEE